jgi:argininosuccinate lyase
MTAGLSGRLDARPAEAWDEEVLVPQFAWDVAHLLDAHLAIEKVQLVEYRRLGLLDEPETAQIAAALATIGPSTLVADAVANTSDVSFAVEQAVRERLRAPAAGWHADRSRNDAQACAQLIWGRAQLIATAQAALDLAAVAAAVAARTATDPMPGLTHLQAAQVITPGFVLAALVEELLRAVDGLRSAHDRMGRCPLGAGAMAGSELRFDRQAMARGLGFDEPEPHALVAVASRSWMLTVAAEIATLGGQLSRFVTDLMMWSGANFGYFRLPDALSGISSAMPQKRNLPVLERIRGRTAHLAAAWVDVALTQRNTPYANSVEVSKESGVALAGMVTTIRSALRLLLVVLEEIDFDRDRMRAACSGEYLGAMSLATRLTVRQRIAWRTAQVVVGRYLTLCEAQRAVPGPSSAALLVSAAAEYGVALDDVGAALAEASSVDGQLRSKRGMGSTHPDRVAELLDAQRARLAAARADLATRSRRVGDAWRRTDAALGLTAGPSSGGPR